jgi:hypothetical protein
MIKKRSSINQNWLQDADTGHKYSQIIGGIAWPYQGKPGYVIVVGEDFIQDESAHARHLRVLKEFESLDVALLVRICQDMQVEYLMDDWYGNLDNRPMVSIYYQLTTNEAAARRFNIFRASHSSDRQALGYYLSVIKEYLRPGKKLLHFGNGSKLPAYLAQVSTDVMGEKADEHAPLAALGYVVAYFFENQPDDEEEDDPHPNRGYAGVNETTGY